MEKVKVLIIDDEQHARTVLKKLLEMKFPEIEVAGEGQSLPEAVDLIYKERPSLVFLDIEMPNIPDFRSMTLLPIITVLKLFLLPLTINMPSTRSRSQRLIIY